MKQNVKRIWLALLMAVCLLALAGCSAQVSEETLDPGLEMVIQQGTQQTLDSFVALDDAGLAEAIAQAEKSKNATMLAAYQAWESVRDDLGALVTTGSVVASATDDGYMGKMQAAFEKREAEFTVMVNEDMMITSVSFAPKYTMGETMTKAGLNTLLGMGTVFVVLIFISWLISCFKYINQWEQSRKNKATAKNAAAPTASPAPAAPVPAAALHPAAAPAAEEVSDDTELIAVIAAAIAASEGKTSTDGLVVRSIRRVPNRNWK